MDIDKMEAGRELDELVAEKVMGMAWANSMDSNGIKFCQLMPRNIITDAYGLGRMGGEVRNSHLPRYSTDIEAAWPIVEKLRFVVRPSLLWNNWIAGRLKGVTGDGKVYVDSWHEAPTAPLAICRAALKAVEGG